MPEGVEPWRTLLRETHTHTLYFAACCECGLVPPPSFEHLLQLILLEAKCEANLKKKSQ